MGAFEMAPSRRAQGARRGARPGHRQRRPDRRRRGRLRRRGAPARVLRRPVRPHLDRWRREPRVPRGQGAARSHRVGGERLMARTPAHRRQLEDEPGPPPGDPLRPEAGLDPARRQARLRRGRGGGAAAVHRPAVRADPRRGDKLRLKYGAQDLSTHTSGPFTGEISGAFLAKLGCTYAVVGHSERREYQKESDQVVNDKVLAAFQHGLTPILCIGENLDIRRGGRAVPFVLEQLGAACSTCDASSAADRHRLRADLGDRDR